MRYQLKNSLSIGLILSAILSYAQWSFAGGGPENVCLVVNANSAESMVIANGYTQLRHIPPNNVVYLPWTGDSDRTNIDEFREKVLKPVLKTLDDRKLTNQIDCITYSSNFPWSVEFFTDFKSPLKKSASAVKPQTQAWSNIVGKRGSLTGLTYLYRRVLNRDTDYTALDANRYMRLTILGRQIRPTMGFRGTIQFDTSDRPVTSGGEKYLLSTTLAVIATEKRQGTTLRQAMDYLKRSTEVDGTQPKGTIYFTITDTIRTKARAGGIRTAKRVLDAMGVPNEILKGQAMALNKKDVLGLTCGTASFTWSTTGSTLLPGSLCDNLTSFGGYMLYGQNQTALTEFLRHGAAGACGTVAEPFLNKQLLAKFPSPMLHVHYLQGCSLGEAFYQSIRAPYQQLIVGDALCQPFARIPVVSVSDISPGQRVQGILTLRPEAKIPPRKFPIAPGITSAEKASSSNETKSSDHVPETVDHFELFVDGIRTTTAKSGEPLSLDTAKLGDGYHELRIVAVGPSPIFTQGRKIIWIVTANHGHTITASKKAGRIITGKPMTISARCPGAERIEVRHNGRILSTIKGSEGSTTVKPEILGIGFGYLQVVGIHGPRPEDQTFARPIVLAVEQPLTFPTNQN